MPHDVVFRDPQWLLALLAIPAALWLRRRRARTVWLVPFAAAWHRPAPAGRRAWPLAAALLGCALVVAALARPQRVRDRVEVRSRGYDIMLVLDLSRSMLSEDYVRDGRAISRFEAALPIVRAFMAQRPNDRLGLIVFAGRAYTAAPLTFHHAWLARQLDRIRVGMIEDGTALGDGVALAVRRLGQPAGARDGRRQGAFVVLLTDGVNNAGLFTPREARELAAERGIPIFTIATGRDGWVRVPYVDAAGRSRHELQKAGIDEEELWMMAMRTGGRFFRAHSRRALAEAFAAIERSHAIEFESRRQVLTAELFPWLAAPGAGLLLVAACGGGAFRRRIVPA